MGVIKSDFCFRKKNSTENNEVRQHWKPVENYESIQLSGQEMRRICFLE